MMIREQMLVNKKSTVGKDTDERGMRHDMFKKDIIPAPKILHRFLKVLMHGFP